MLPRKKKIQNTNLLNTPFVMSYQNSLKTKQKIKTDKKQKHKINFFQRTIPFYRNFHSSNIHKYEKAIS